MKKILMIMQSTPFPARRSGISMRYYPIIEKLKETYEISIISLSSPSNKEEDFESDIKQIIFPKKTELNRSSLNKIAEKIVLGIKFLSPFHPPHYHIHKDDEYLAQNITQFVKTQKYEKIIWAGPDCCSLFLQTPLQKYCNDIIFDFIDSPYLLASRSELDFFHNNTLKKYERWKTKLMESQARKKASKIIYISAVDATSASSSTNKISVIPNGILINDHVSTQAENIPPKSIGFFGDMGYAPNKEAVKLLLTQIFPQLYKLDPDINLYLIGKNYTSKGQQLPPNVHITGYVENIWTYINAMEVLVFPIMQGAGLKNKVLEAMYSGKAVLTTNIGNEGIDATHNKEIFLCNKIEDYPKLISQLINSPENRENAGRNAKKYVEKNFSWPSLIDTYIKSINEK